MRSAIYLLGGLAGIVFTHRLLHSRVTLVTGGWVGGVDCCTDEGGGTWQGPQG